MMTTETNDNSGGTGYSAGNDFTIKPLTTTVDIKLIRRLMATWHTNGLTDSNIRKILLLYFGEPAWMNLDKVYDRNMFGQIAKGMNFHSRHSFIEAILKSTGFGFIWKNKRCMYFLFGASVTGGAWLSSARVVRCWVKSRNERNPCS